MSGEVEFYDLIRRPVITEKATNASEAGTVVFEVAMNATKPEIKKAVEALFKVKVKGVNTTVSKGKVKRFKGKLGKEKETLFEKIKSCYDPRIHQRSLVSFYDNASVVKGSFANMLITHSTLQYLQTKVLVFRQ